MTTFEEIRNPSDMVVAMEVIEHIVPDDSIPFLKNCAERTGKLFALTTPNFEYWSRFRAREPYKECRWLPDHALDYRPASKNPHDHKQEMTPENLGHYMNSAFPASDFEVMVMRAWPWELKDMARNSSFKLFFKLFAIAVRRQKA